jgi:hypothetical protein
MDECSYHILPIIHAYNLGTSRLRSYIPTPVALPDSCRYHNFGRISWLRSMSVPHVLPPQLWRTSYDRVRWLQHLTIRTLSQKQTGRGAWLDQHSKPQYLTASHVQVVWPCAAWPTTLSLAWSERNLSIQKDSVPLQHGQIKVFECLVRRAKALSHATMTLRTDHT